MKKFSLASFTIALMALFITGCMAANNNRAKTLNEAGQYTSPTSPLMASPGRKFNIIIASNPTTGYSWQIAKPIDEKVIKFVKSEYSPAGSGLTGAGGTEIWTFVAVAAGETLVSLKYVRPWEKEKPPAADTTYTVIVR